MRKKRLVRVAWLLLVVLVLVGVGVRFWASKSDVMLTISCPQKEFKFGNEIRVTLTLTNNGESTFPRSDSPAWYERIPYIGEWIAANRTMSEPPHLYDEYRLIVSKPNGAQLLRSGPFFPDSWASQLTIEPGQSASEETVLNDWALISKPGTYRVKAVYTNKISVPKKKDKVLLHCRSQPIEVVITPRTDEEMGLHIHGLIEKIRTAEDDEEESSLINKLMYTRDNRIVATLLDFAYAGKHSEQVKAALRDYLPLDPQTKKILMRAARERGLIGRAMFLALVRFGCTDEEMRELIAISFSSGDLENVMAGVKAAQDFPDDSHMRPLIKLARDANGIVQNEAIKAICRNRTGEGVKLLQKILEDEDQKSTRGAIKNAYQYYEWCKDGHKSEQYAARLISDARNVSSSERWFAIWTICNFSREVLAAAKTLIENPEAEPRVTATDEAVVEAIRELLNNPDGGTRDLMVTAIRLAPRIYRGRPLRPEDFPEIYAEYEKERDSGNYDW